MRNTALKDFRVVNPKGEDGWPVQTHPYGEVFVFNDGSLLDLRHEGGPKRGIFRRVWDAILDR